MAVVPANNDYAGQGFDEVVVHGSTQSRAITAVAVDQNAAVAIRYEENIHHTTLRTESGEEVTVTERQKVIYIAIMVRIFNYVENAEENAVDDYFPPDSCSEQCADVLCRSCSCNLSNLCSCKVSGVIKSEQILSNLLRKARNLGVKFLFVDGLIFPLLNHVVRDAVVGGELLYTIVGLILSIINYINADCHQVFNIVYFTFGILAALAGIASSVQALYRRNFLRRSCQKTVEQSNVSGITQVIDLSRTVIAEILIYPLLICSIFSLVTSRPFETRSTNDIVGLVRFALSAASFVVFVYVLRLAILAGAILQIVATQKRATTASKWTIYFLLYFFVYTTLQMMVQAFMIVVTGREIYEENLHFYNASNYTNESEYEYLDSSFCLPVKVSGGLWYMIVGTYLFPIFGLFMFFVVGHYWVQEFFIAIFISVTSLIQTSTLFDVKEKGRSMAQTLHNLNERYLPQEALLSDFNDFSSTCFCTKFGYPFKSPALIIACIAFLILNYLFISFGSEISTIGPFTFFLALISSTGWSLVYFTGAVIGIAANAYTFMVGIVWLILIEIIIFIICMLWPCLCVLLFFCGGKSGS